MTITVPVFRTQNVLQAKKEDGQQSSEGSASKVPKERAPVENESEATASSSSSSTSFASLSEGRGLTRLPAGEIDSVDSNIEVINSF